MCTDACELSALDDREGSVDRGLRSGGRQSYERRGVVMSDYDLELNVGEELVWDPKVDSVAIAVSADDGVVTLRGTVGSFRQKREAKQDAERVYGVKSVDNQLEVRILSEDRRDDAELRGSVLQALMLDSLVPATIDCKVEAGWVTLTGTAEWQFQRDEAEFIAANVLGVVAVNNEVELVGPVPSGGDVKHSIKKAMERNAKLDADGVSVESSNGTVTLRGTVSSFADHDEAVAAAWAAPGVTDVKDHVLVAY
jgi:osmotically-inducible protein OsmY